MNGRWFYEVARSTVLLAVLLAALLAIGYATKFSTHYSRRAVFTWVVLGPAFIIVATYALRWLIRKYPPSRWRDP